METANTLTNSIKIRAKQLFKISFAPSKTFISVKDIKALFPSFDARKATHWFNLIDKCESKIQETEVVEISTLSLSEFNAHYHKLVLEAAKKYECTVGDIDWIFGFSAKLYARDSRGISRLIGELQVDRQGQVSITWTKYMSAKSVANVSQAFRVLLSMFAQPVAA